MRPAILPSGPMAVPKVLAALVRMRPARAWMLVVLCLDLAAIADAATGSDLWFGPGYLFVICLAAWSRGWGAGQIAGLACMAVTFAINGIALYPYGEAALLSNFVMRFLAISLVVAVVGAMRRTYVREWYLARTDALTGAFNRQAFFELGRELCARRAWRLMVYADLDGLKAINDNRGHAAGDACLRLYAAGVRKAIRRGDLFARVGGDEFLLFVAVSDEAAARAFAARLHGTMNAIAAADGAPLRCSVGALAVPPGERSIDDLVRLADALMYEAKLAGAALKVAVTPGTVTAGRARATPRRHSDSDRRTKLAA